MWIISPKACREFWEKHPESESALRQWVRTVRFQQWSSFAELRRIYPSADLYGKCIIFNVGGNKYRVIAAVHFNTKMLYIRHVLTHAEYDRGAWKSDCE